ncbi:MAG: hypothetical protein ACXIUZ_02395 [Lysobacteraceae bacterium]
MNLRTALILPVLAAGVLLAGCQRSFDFDGDASHIQLRGDTLHFRADGQPRARLDADGRFEVDGREVETTPAQRQALVAYHAGVIGFADAATELGKQTGTAAAGAARDAVRERFRGGGEDGEGGQEFGERIANQVKAQVAESLGPLCARMEAMHGLQQGVLDAGVQAFQPYARMTPDSARRCHEKLAEL